MRTTELDITPAPVRSALARLSTDGIATVHAACALPTRAGIFRVVGHGTPGGPDVTVALIHGDPAVAPEPLVHVHMACVFGDVFRSLGCPCRAALEDAVATIVRDGAGVVVYSRPESAAVFACTHAEGVSPTVAAGLLRAAGVDRLRLSERAAGLASALRERGLTVGR